MNLTAEIQKEIDLIDTPNFQVGEYIYMGMELVGHTEFVFQGLTKLIIALKKHCNLSKLTLMTNSPTLTK